MLSEACSLRARLGVSWKFCDGWDVRLLGKMSTSQEGDDLDVQVRLADTFDKLVHAVSRTILGERVGEEEEEEFQSFIESLASPPLDGDIL